MTPIGAAANWVDRDWPALFASMCGQILTVGTLTIYSFGVFIRPLEAEFGWSRTQLSIAIAISQYTIGLTAPFWGTMTDRFGTRAILLPTIVMLSVLIASLGLLTPHLWQLYLMFFLIPLLGPSTVLHPSAMARLFDRHLGLALGLSVMGVGVGGTVLPRISHGLIASVGWRDAYGCLGVLAALVGLPMALVLTRHIRGPVPGRRAVPILPMVRTRRFALICTVFPLLGLVTIGTLVHLVPLMVGRGLPPARAASIAGLAAFASLVSRGMVGWILDRVRVSYVIAATTLAAVTALLILALDPGHGADVVAVILLGAAIGGEIDFAGFVIRRSFPAAAFGRLYGLLFLVFTLGTGTGPIVMGLSFDHLGSYRPGLLLFAAVGVVAAVTVLTIPRLGVPEAVPRTLTSG